MKIQTHVLGAFAVSKDCVLWPFGKSSTGYGNVYNPSDRKTYSIHRIAYEAAYGKVPSGKVVMHLCDNKSCFELSHLKLGTQKENVKDAMEKKLFCLAPNKIPEHIRKKIRKDTRHRLVVMKEYGIGSGTYYNIRKEPDELWRSIL